MGQVVDVVEHDRWVELVLNRPEKRNALSMALMDELEDHLGRADADPAVHAILISARGPDFCGGFDLADANVAEPGAGPADADVVATTGGLMRSRQVMRRIHDLQKPVVARVHGRCLAGGTELAFLCDMVLADLDAEFGFPPVRDMGTPAVPMWLYHAGPQWAKRLLFTGDSISGADAAKLGLVLKALPAAELDREVAGLMARLAKIDWQLLAQQKRIVNLGLELAGMLVLHRIAPQLDAMAFTSPTSKELARTPREEVVAMYKHRRNEVFGTGLARIEGPDPYDDQGRLVLD